MLEKTFHECKIRSSTSLSEDQIIKMQELEIKDVDKRQDKRFKKDADKMPIRIKGDHVSAFIH